MCNWKLQVFAVLLFFCAEAQGQGKCLGGREPHPPMAMYQGPPTSTGMNILAIYLKAASFFWSIAASIFWKGCILTS